MATIGNVASLLYAITGTLQDFDYLVRTAPRFDPKVDGLSKHFHELWKQINAAIEASRRLPRAEATDIIACLMRARSRIALAEHDAAHAAISQPPETVNVILLESVRDVEQECNAELKRLASRLSAMSYLHNEPLVTGSRVTRDPQTGAIAQEDFTAKPFPNEPTLDPAAGRDETGTMPTFR